MTDQTPVRSSRRIGTLFPSSSRETVRAVGAQTESVGVFFRKTGPRAAPLAAFPYSVSRTPAVCTPVAASRAPLAARWVAIS